jgi:phosphatidylglycerophosphate synthase
VFPPRAADALGYVRLAAAALLPWALRAGARAAWVPIVIFAVAAATDFLDGIVARRGSGATAHGAVLDSAADVAFVLAGTGVGAAAGLITPAVPLAIGVAFAAYATASWRLTLRAGTGRMARSALGHAAGVLNYALTGLVVGAIALPGTIWPPLLALGSIAVLAANAGAVLARLLPALVRRARAPRAGERGARWPRSSA